MQYNISFEMAGALVLLIVAVRFFSREQFPLLSVKFFGVLIFVALADIIFDILSFCFLDGVFPKSVPLVYATTAIYYAMQIALPSAIAFYLLSLVSQDYHLERKSYVFVAIPGVLIELVFLSTVFFGLVFTVDENCVYGYGPLSFLPYLSVTLYIIVGTIVLFIKRKKIPKEVRQCFHPCNFFLVALTFVQLLNPSIILTGFAMSIVILVYYFTIEEPSNMIDDVTRTYGFRALQILLTTEMACKENSSITLVEIHGLRSVNTVFGTKTGDALLRDVVNYFQGGNTTWIFRLEGTRFVIVATTDAALDVLQTKLNNRKIFEWPIANDTARLALTSYCLCSSGSFDGGTLLNIIENAMIFNESNSAEGSISQLDEQEIRKLKRRSEIQTELDYAVKNGTQFSLVYQPIYNLKTQRYTHLEALLRFNHSAYGTVSPSEFIPIIEKNGLMPLLDKIVVRLLLEDIKTGMLDKLGIDGIHFNLSSTMLINTDGANEILRMVNDYGISPSFLVAEITETIASSSNKSIEGCITALSEGGIKVALDDFGSGYSNLSRIITLPFNIVKLDRTLLQGPQNVFKLMYKAVEEVADEIIVEGVENEDQLALVKQCGMPSIQGFYYAYPMSIEKLVCFIRNVKQ